MSLRTRKSTSSASVTLYELTDIESRPKKRVKVDLETEADSEYQELEQGSSTQVKKPKPEPKSPRKSKQLATLHPAPENWRAIYDSISEMRYSATGCAREAPVDTMGCDVAGEGEGEDGDEKNKRFSILVSLMLSSQTRDLVTHTAVSNLRTALRSLGHPGLSPEALASAPPDLILNAINKVGFWRRKAEYIREAAQQCRDKYDGDVPNTLEGLLELKGVGKKMAYLMLGSGWGLNVGIGVDVHVHRISNRLGWHAPPTKTPEETRINLESWLPHELHQKINHLLVGFGQTICSPVKPSCGECSLSGVNGGERLCPSAQFPKSTSRTTKISTSSKTTKSSKVGIKTKTNAAEKPMGEVTVGDMTFKTDSQVKQELLDDRLEGAHLEEARGGPEVKIEWEGNEK
ncbi:DNA glycosylase [Rhodocollybia butyracea]|uniref:Endonuclease III homolog n=1 Tax=Rhodocollybia butyracea TaxID=206335 RepID=A0A9P5P380_9AGAR|nr:DNA glycosylase [Rhodocollybia butyracea]